MRRSEPVQMIAAVDDAAARPEAERRRQLAEALAEVSRLVSRSLEPSVVQQRIVDSACALLGARESALYLVEPHTGSRVAVATSGSTEAVLGLDRPVPPDVGLTGLAVREGRLCTSHDVLADSRALFPPEHRARLERLPARALLSVPLLAQGRPIGALNVADRAGRVFDDIDRWVVEALAAQAVVAIENARLYAEMRRRQEQAERLQQVTHALTERLDTQGVAALAVEAAVSGFGFGSAVLRRLELDGGLIVLASSGAARDHYPPGHRLPVGLGLAGRAVAEGRPIWSADVLADPAVTINDDVRESVTRSGTRAVLSVPLRARGQVIGVLSVTLDLADGAPQAVAMDAMPPVQALAAQAALALANAQLYEESERRRQAASALAAAAELRLQHLATVSPVIVYSYRPEGARDVYVSERVRDQLGYEAHEFLDDPEFWAARIHPDDRPRVLAELPSMLKRGHGTLQYRFRRRDGTYRRMLDDFRAVRAADGTPIEVVGYWLDVTRRWRAEETARALIDTNRLLTESTDARKGAQQITDAIQALSSSTVATLYELEPESGDLRVIAASGYTFPIPTRVLPRGTGLSAIAVREGRPVFTADLVADPRVRLTPELRTRFEQALYRAGLAVPLTVEGRVVGTLSLGDERGRVYGEEEVHLARAFADIAALALESARLSALDLARRTQRVVLAEIGRELVTVLDPDRLLGLIVRRASELFAANGIVHLVTADGALAPGAWTARIASVEATIPASRGVVGRAVQERRSVVVNDYQGWADAVPRFREAGVTRVMTCPLTAGERVLGVVSMDRIGPEAPPFTAEDVEVLERFAEHATIAIRNAKLFRQEQTARREAEAGHHVRDIVEGLDAIVWESDVASSRKTFVSRRAEALFGYPQARWLEEPDFRVSHIHPDDRERAVQLDRECLAGGGDYELDYRFLAADGRVVWVHDRVRIVRDAAGRPAQRRGVMVDVTARRRAQALLASERQVLELIASGSPLGDVLAALCRLVEGQGDGTLCSVLLTDPDGGHLRDGAGPSLPEAYRQAVDCVPIGPAVGSWGTAAYRREPVIVSDIAEDPLWADYRALALLHGLRACWSTPILGGDGSLLGTFALYYGTPRCPDPPELELVERATELARLAIWRHRSEEASLDMTRILLRQRDRLRVLAESQLTAREDEAKRIARALHDEAGQLLAAVHLELGAIAGELAPQAPGLTPGAASRFVAVRRLLDDIEERLRQLSHELRPTVLDDLGLRPAVEFLAQGVARRSGLQATVSGSSRGRLPPLTETVAYRAVQEALTNVTRHARATRIEIELEWDEVRLRCAVRDDGTGFDEAAVMSRPGERGLGLIGMRERIAALGGTLEITSATGQGTELRIAVPLE